MLTDLPIHIVTKEPSFQQEYSDPSKAGLSLISTRCGQNKEQWNFVWFY